MVCFIENRTEGTTDIYLVLSIYSTFYGPGDLGEDPSDPTVLESSPSVTDESPLKQAMEP